MRALRKNAAMSFAPPPPVRHLAARGGAHRVRGRVLHRCSDGHHIEGWTTAVEDGHAWLVAYEIDVGDDWVTRSAKVTNRTVDGTRSTVLEADEYGRWRVDGIPAPQLDGCLDVDLESSAMTNAFPVHRLALGVRRTLACACRLRAGRWISRSNDSSRPMNDFRMRAGGRCTTTSRRLSTSPAG